MSTLHPELKALKAALIRINFLKYLDSESFRLLFMEHDFDEAFSQALSSYSKFSSERKIDAFLHVLNWLLYHWIHAEPRSEDSKQYHSKFRKWLFIAIIDFYQWHQGEVVLKPLYDALLKIGIVEKPDVEYLKAQLERATFKKEATTEMTENTTIEKLIDMRVEYAIITALEDDEMEKALPLFKPMQEIDETNHFIEIGELTTNPNKKIAFASQHSTGMVDAAILAAELITRFKPKYLIMIGVLGGKPDETNIGDVVIATKVFEIDKGKVDHLGFRRETSSASITSKDIKKIQRKKKDIETYINSEDQTRDSNVKVHFGPIASVNQVIDLEGFFESSITSLDRKAIALEMESFAVTRACQLLNKGQTIPIVIKSVMDNTAKKTDANKIYAAWTSAKTLEYLLKNEII